MGEMRAWGGLLPSLLLAIAIVASPAHAQFTDPAVLSSEDVGLYQQIFEVQERGDWDTADRMISRLENRTLMGHVQFQRYMHPTAYRSRFSELRDWMAHYADQPEANRIYALAQRRRPSGAAVPTRPERRRWRVSAQPIDPFDDFNPARSRAQQTRVRQIENHVRSLIRRERPTQSMIYLNEGRTRNDLTQWEFDRLRTSVARSYYAEQRDDLAFEIASEVAARSGGAIPDAYWWAGLSAWRLGHVDQAAAHFASLARANEVDPWVRSAGAYWAARSYMVSFEPRHVVPMLEIAAGEPTTFYGVLATRQLGRDLAIDFAPQPLIEAEYRELLNDRGIERAIALTQIGRTDLAEDELIRAHGRIDNDLDLAYLALTQVLELPHAQLMAAISSSDPRMRAGLYPIPDYAPDAGFDVDQALVLAFARQESKFDPDATSRVGARGLMQVLPRTASFITGDRSLNGGERNKLYDPSYNLEVGQLYINRLMNSYDTGRNLFMLAVAYNGGPGNLRRWMEDVEFQDDPLLFIESIPAPETRGFIEAVLTNFWIYRIRLGQDAPSLDLVAEGSWPEYQSVNTFNSSTSFQ